LSVVALSMVALVVGLSLVLELVAFVVLVP
jgi:hypothetical protein